MIIDWLELAPALLFLLVPIGLVRGPKIRHRPIVRDWGGHWAAILSLGLHWIDLGRAILGAWWLADAIPLDPAAVGFVRYSVPAVRGAVLLVAVVLQVVVCFERQAFYAPFMFVSGMLLGFYPPLIAGFAVLLALTIAAGLRLPTTYFPLLCVSLVVIGYFFEERPALVSLAVGGGVTLLPWLLPVMFRRAPVLAYRARRLVRPVPGP
ncbi:MAG: hypothetical protein NTV51_15035 [Verrucomicrobia bacterium]|nr:hypothetical protein [Verrucomicrobiota bacterium]